MRLIGKIIMVVRPYNASVLGGEKVVSLLLGQEADPNLGNDEDTPISSVIKMENVEDNKAANDTSSEQAYFSPRTQAFLASEL